MQHNNTFIRPRTRLRVSYKCWCKLHNPYLVGFCFQCVKPQLPQRSVWDLCCVGSPRASMAVFSKLMGGGASRGRAGQPGLRHPVVQGILKEVSKHPLLVNLDQVPAFIKDNIVW